MRDRIIALLDRELAIAEHNLVNGACPDYTSYREMVSVIMTLRSAIDIVKKAFAEDDDDE